MTDKRFYIDKLKYNLEKISRIKSDILMTQNIIMDESFYDDDIEEVFEKVDIALENAKEELDSLIEMIEMA